MVELPRGTMVGNPLYRPVKTEEGYSLEFLTAPGGLWIASRLPNIVVSPSYLGTNRVEINDFYKKWKSEGVAQGSLDRIHKFLVIKLFNTQINIVGEPWPLSLEEALDEKLLKQVSYDVYFKRHYPKHPELIAQARNIHPSQNRVYYVTRKGHNIVEIDIQPGDSEREEDEREQLYLPGLTPRPVLG